MQLEEKARDKKEPPKIVYKLEGDAISLSNAPAQFIGEVLLNMQGLIYSIAGSQNAYVGGRRPKKIEELYTLNVSFEEGSFEMEFTPALLAPDLEDTIAQIPTFNKASNFLGVLPHRNVDYEELKLEVERQIDNPKSRIATLNHLRRLIPPDGKKAKIRFENINGNGSEIELHDDVLKRRVEQLLREEMKNYEIEISGVVSRIKDDVPFPSFFLKDWSGKLVRVQMPEEKRGIILDYLANRVPIKLIGAGNKKKLLEISDLIEIEPNTEVLIESSHDITFKSPIKAKLAYERYDEKSDFWVVSSEELGIYGVEDTVEKAKKAFENELHIDYMAYKDIDDTQLTQKALELKRKLIGIFQGS